MIAIIICCFLCVRVVLGFFGGVRDIVLLPQLYKKNVNRVYTKIKAYLDNQTYDIDKGHCGVFVEKIVFVKVVR